MTEQDKVETVDVTPTADAFVHIMENLVPREKWNEQDIIAYAGSILAQRRGLGDVPLSRLRVGVTVKEAGDE